MALNSKKILIIDDNEEQLLLARTYLSSFGYEVTTTTEVTCIPLVMSFQPHLILVDINMPDMSGDKLVRIFNHSPGFLDRSVVLLYSALEENALGVIARSTGASGWVSKNQDISCLLEEVRKWMLVAEERRGES